MRLRVPALFALLLLLQCVPPAGAAAAEPTPACRSQVMQRTTRNRPFRDCDGAPEMIALRGGTYRMGDQVGDGQPYEKPPHEVRLAPFAIGRFEVTNAEWQACVAAAGCSAPGVAADPQHSRYPVAGVSWTQAQTYADWLATRTGKPYRLPSEAEWEYAARAGEQGRYPWGSFELDACKQVNLLDASGKREHPQWYWAERCDDHFAAAAPVGSFPPNAWGLHDMIGNVWEWVADCWHVDYSGAPANGAAWMGDNCRKHVNRGGGWGNNLRAMRLSSRDGDPTAATSDGLGLRVARSLSAAELPRTTPDTPPPPTVVAQVPAASHGSSSKAVPATAATAVAAPAPPVFVTSLATERDFEVHVTVNGTQTWRNALQHSQGSTAQDYVLSTRLRSDGVLYGDNLLDPDQNTRLAVKQQFLARRGLIQLKALNGGHLPHTAEELAAFTARVQASMPECVGDEACGGAVAERAAALDALRDNPVQDLETLIDAPANGEPARWLYFFGYAGCPTHIHISNETHIAGERAYDHARKTLVPWSLDRSANSEGGAEDRAGLCQHYTATIDTYSGEVYLENLYLPSAPGSSVRTIHRSTEHRDETLPVPSEVLAWTNAQLAHTRETLNTSATLVPHMPLDGDSTVMGQFDGRLDVTLSWSFKPVDGAPAAAR
jgi:formylglycine-generating enzyme required for sulfatase activity